MENNKISTMKIGLDLVTSINEPYQYKDINDELITDKPSTPLNNIEGYWKASNSDDISMEMYFNYTHPEGISIREEYADLVAEMWMAKHRNEIIVKEIVEKHNRFNKSLKNRNSK